MSDRLLRQPLLDDDPGIESMTRPRLRAFVGAIEQASTERYARLAEAMARRGETATAAALRELLERQREHQAAMLQLSACTDGVAGPAVDPASELPASLRQHWDDASRSALLTPYRVYALAVESARRNFSFYSYLSARAPDPGVQAEIDALAAEELRHAAALRQLRRRAWHAERRPVRLPDLTVGSRRALGEVLAQHETMIAHQLSALAAQLQRLGDAQSAALLQETVRSGAVPHPGVAPPAPTPAPIRADEDHVVRGRDPIAAGGEDARSLLAAWARGDAAESAPADATPGQLLVRAQKPLEAFSETLEAILRTSEGALFERAAAAMDDVTARLARLTQQAERRLQQEGQPEKASS